MTGAGGADAVPAPPGWRPDPASPVVERWWDGLDWTEHTRRAPEWGGVRRLPEREPVLHALDDGTRPLGWIVASPFWAGPVLVIASLVGDWVPAAVVMALLIAALCLLDRRALRRRGSPRVPSRWWAALGAVGYLAGRRRALGQVDAAGVWIVTLGWALMAVPIFVFSAVRLGIAAAQQ